MQDGPACGVPNATCWAFGPHGRGGNGSYLAAFFPRQIPEKYLTVQLCLEELELV